MKDGLRVLKQANCLDALNALFHPLYHKLSLNSESTDDLAQHLELQISALHKTQGAGTPLSILNWLRRREIPDLTGTRALTVDKVGSRRNTMLFMTLHLSWRKGISGGRCRELPGTVQMLRWTHELEMPVHLPSGCGRLLRGELGEHEWRRRVVDYQDLCWTPLNNVPLALSYWDQHGLPRDGLSRLPNQPRNPPRYPRNDLRAPMHEVCAQTMSPGMWKGDDPNVNAEQYLHGMWQWVDWRKVFYTYVGEVRAVLANNHRVFEEIALDIVGWRRVLVASGPDRRVVNFYLQFYPSPAWKALTPKVRLWLHRVYVDRSIYCWPDFVYRGFTHLVDYQICVYCGTANAPEHDECHAHFQDSEPPPPQPPQRERGRINWRRHRHDKRRDRRHHHEKKRDPRCGTSLRGSQIMRMTPQLRATREYFRCARKHRNGEDADESRPPTRHPAYWHPSIPVRPLPPRQTAYRPTPQMQAAQVRPPRAPRRRIISPCANYCDEHDDDEFGGDEVHGDIQDVD